MKKNLLIAAIAITALASCSSDEFVGDQSPQTSSGTVGAITFGSNAPAITRTNSTDAAKINYLFKVFGMKTVNSSDQRVFATATTGVTPYDVWFVDNTGNSTTSNSSNWEYVGNIDATYGTTGHTVTLGAEQTIKYWDYAATEYNFQAWSDVNDDNNKVSITAIGKNTMTITGTPAKLANLYIADLATINPSTSPTTVQFTFRNMAAKVRLGIYETIPGYVVKDLTFHYNDGSAKTSTTNAYLTGSFIGSSSAEAIYNITYSGTPQKAILSSNGDTYNTTYFNFGSFASSESIGTESTNPTWATGASSFTNVLPNTSNVGAMTLTVDYTLYNASSGETINLTGQTATVPAAYMSWKPNYAYTYLFKITDDKLTPITLDAVIIDAGDGTQETITTVSTPSITTYAKESAVTTENEYKTNSNIYVVVDKSGVQALTVGTNAKLYLVTNNTGEGTAQEITEASVANALEHGTATDANNDQTNDTWTVTGAGMKPLIVTTNSVPTLTATSSIAADDSPTGVAITINGAKFTPTAAGTYVFEFIDTADGNKKYYKVIKVAAAQ